MATEPMMEARHSFQPDCANCSLASICLPIALEDDDVVRLEDVLKRGALKRRGEHVFRAADACDSLFAVRSGAIKSYRVSADGEEQITGFHLPGEIFGLSGIPGRERESNAVALETASVCEIPYDGLERLSREVPALQRHLFQLMSQTINDDQQLMLLLSKKSAEERIASLLLSISSRMRRRRLSGRCFRLPVSRGEIGNHLGLVVETVSRVFTRLQKQGVLAVDGREVEILQPAALAELAGTDWVDD